MYAKDTIKCLLSLLLSHFVSEKKFFRTAYTWKRLISLGSFNLYFFVREVGELVALSSQRHFINIYDKILLESNHILSRAYMLRIYHRKGCTSSQRALNWFEQYEININNKIINQISKKELLHLLTLTEQGLEDIMKHPSKCSSSNKQKLDCLKDMTLSEALEYLEKNTELLQSPIIIEKDKFLVGYNAEEIRQFIPKEYRHFNLKN